ncbi:MAG: GNAT family N-acetyltransferase [Deltaproteobacteria bacterium GWA2_54_12]|nr:MAG: GNAT family N-acetyltransferase [Deltaproteobacteria bacterium GWA2_54_12]
MLRKAVSGDVPAIYEIVEAFAKKGIMLHRAETDICDSLRDFFVYESDGAVVGTCALHICSSDMGEIRSLAVREGHTRAGIGTKLVTACLDEARSLGLKKVFALTYQTAFFNKLRFKVINKDLLPHKIWGDCIKCVKFPNCDENAVIIAIEGQHTPEGGKHEKHA